MSKIITVNNAQFEEDFSKQAELLRKVGVTNYVEIAQHGSFGWGQYHYTKRLGVVNEDGSYEYLESMKLEDGYAVLEFCFASEFGEDAYSYTYVKL